MPPRIVLSFTMTLLTTWVAGGGRTWAASSASGVTCAPFRVVNAPRVEGGHAAAIDGTSPSDLWTVGAGPLQPAILHWDGSRWRVAPQDDLEGSSTAVAAITPTDAWIVGDTPPFGSTPMSKHWDGTLWRSVRMPLVGTDHSLFSITALGSDDVWAAGQYNSGGPLHPLVMRWDGSAWTHVPAPDGVPNAANVFYGIDAVGSTDIWAVGYTDVSLNSQPLIEHWDGVAWEMVPTPSFPGNNNILNDISALGPDDVWAAGFQGDSFSGKRTLAMHWDGTAWTVVETPDVEGTLDSFGGVYAASATDVWAVGQNRVGFSDATLVEHWDGSAWTIVSSPPTGNGGFDDVLAITPTTVWAAGAAFDPNINNTRPLTMRSKGCWPS